MKIENRNSAIPLNEEVTTQSITPGGDRSIQDSEDRTPRTEFGIANTQDTFEIPMERKSIIDPGPYPGEEWLWQETADSTAHNTESRLTADQFQILDSAL